MKMPIQNPEKWVRLTQARESKNMSQRALADIIGVDPVSMNRWEHGNSRPDWDNLRKLSKALGVTIDYLLSNDDMELFDAEETATLLNAAMIINKKVAKK